MLKYLDENAGSTPEGDTVKDLVDEVWNIWKQDGLSILKSRLKNLNRIRAKYRFKSGNFDYAGFLKGEYDMDSDSRFIKNALDFDSLLQDPEIGGPLRYLYGSEQDIRFIQQVLKRIRLKI